MSRIGLQIPNFTYDVPDGQLFGKVVELATAAEETGFDSVWVMDHFYQLPPLGGPERPMLEAYTLLGASVRGPRACGSVRSSGASLTGTRRSSRRRQPRST